MAVPADALETLVCGGLKAEWPSSVALPAATCDLKRTSTPLVISGDATIGMAADVPAYATTPIIIDSTADPQVTLDSLAVRCTESPLTILDGGSTTLIVRNENSLTSTDAAALNNIGQGTLTIASSSDTPGTLLLIGGSAFAGIDSSEDAPDVTISNSNPANPLRLITQGFPAITSGLRTTTDLPDGSIVWWTSADQGSPLFASRSKELTDLTIEYLAVEVPVASHAITIDLAGGNWPATVPLPMAVMKYAGDVTIDATPTRDASVFAGWTSNLRPAIDPTLVLTIPETTTSDVLVLAHWYTTPGSVQNLQAAPTDKEIALSWAVPTSDGGSPIVGYQVAYSQDGTTWAGVPHNNTATSARISKLTNGVSYRVRVSAVNQVGLVGEPRQTIVTPSASPIDEPDPDQGDIAFVGGSGPTEYYDSLGDADLEEEDIAEPKLQGLDPIQVPFVAVMALAIFAAGAVAVSWQSGEHNG